ncbi:helix-turn-helix domain-containing protein [Orbaceae bacterium ac157xtp]
MGTLHDENTESQCLKILKDLQAGQKITQLDAYSKYGSTRLGARIYDLKKKGYAINSVMVQSKHNGKWYAQYSMRVN